MVRNRCGYYYPVSGFCVRVRGLFDRLSHIRETTEGIKEYL